MQTKPIDYADIVALITFTDVPPIPTVGFTVTEDGTTLFFVKISREIIAWERIVAWRYLSDIWPEHLFYQGETINE